MLRDIRGDPTAIATVAIAWELELSGFWVSTLISQYNDVPTSTL
jgi:hypothetical protein